MISAKKLLEEFGKHPYNLKVHDAVRIAKLTKDGSYKGVDEALEEFDRAVGNYGVEAIEGKNFVDHYYQHFHLLYSNTGDTYATTLMYDTVKEKFFIGSWGSYVEFYPKRFDYLG